MQFAESRVCSAAGRLSSKIGVLLCAGLLLTGIHTALADRWTAIGPSSTIVGSSPYIYALAAAPTTPTTLYVGTNRGMFKSPDGGATWARISTGLPDSLPKNIQVAANGLAIDPTMPSTLYAGEVDFSFAAGNRLFKSTDSGASWSVTGLTTQLGIDAVAVDPLVPTTLYAGADLDGVFKSTDGGTTWAPINSGLPAGTSAFIALAIDPLTPSTLYAMTANAGVFKTTDGGESWILASAGLILSGDALAIDPITPTTLYAGTNGGSGVYKSIDGGDTWAPVTIPNTPDVNAIIQALAIDPTAPTTLYAGSKFVALPSPGGGGSVLKSTDGGDTWLDTDLSDHGTKLSVFVLIIDPNMPTTVYAGTYGFGVFVIHQDAAGMPTPTSTPSDTPASSPTRTPTAVNTPVLCVGDCDGSATVTIDELLTLVNIALGNSDKTCPSGMPNGSEVNIALIIQAVNNALNGCTLP